MTSINPYDKAHELSGAIQASKVYQDYVAAQKNLSQNTESLQKVQDFRDQQIKVNQASALGQEVSEGMVSDLSLQYVKLNKDELIAAYFQAEAMFVQMFDDIQKILQKGLEKGFQE